MRCSLLRPRRRTTGRVWATHRRTLLGWITRTVSSAATWIGLGPKRTARSFRGSGPSPGADHRPATSAIAGSMGGNRRWSPLLETLSRDEETVHGAGAGNAVSP